MNFSDNNVISVSAANDFVKRIIDNNPYLCSVNIRGEISNFTNHIKSGHFYFSIKDEQSALKCVMFSFNAKKAAFLPENGMKIVAHGRISVFVRDGIYVFYVDSIKPDGIGELYLRYEKLKKELDEKGMFSPDNKKPIPKYPERIGVITSATGAAVRDIINISKRRYPLARIILYPALVQGAGAEDDLCNGIKAFDENVDVDVVIIGRGGGSIEDLWAFNSRKLAYAIFNCKTPVISAVGHETDFTICDFVSDLRAPTPSAAAELALPDKETLKRQLANVQKKLDIVLSNKLTVYKYRLQKSKDSRFLKSADSYLNEKRIFLDRLYDGMESSILFKIKDCRYDLANITSTLNNSVDSKYKEDCNKLGNLNARLTSLDPMAVLKRGYSAIYDKNGRVIKSIKDAEIGEAVTMKTFDGALTATVNSKRSK